VIRDYVVSLLTDPSATSVPMDECLRIVRTLIDNMRNEPAQAKYRLLKFDNAMLSRLFFPVPGAVGEGADEAAALSALAGRVEGEVA
jgi:hypothetical protein